MRDSSPTAPQYIQQSWFAAEKLGFELQVLTEHHPSDLEKLLVAARASDALVVGDDTEFTTFRTKIAELAITNKVPTIHGLREIVDAGGLIAYGASFHDLYRRAASQVKKILQGAKPSDLPIGQPTKFEFVVNVRTAQALELKLSPIVLMRLSSSRQARTDFAVAHVKNWLAAAQINQSQRDQTGHRPAIHRRCPASFTTRAP